MIKLLACNRTAATLTEYKIFLRLPAMITHDAPPKTSRFDGYPYALIAMVNFQAYPPDRKIFQCAVSWSDTTLATEQGSLYHDLAPAEVTRLHHYSMGVERSHCVDMVAGLKR